MAQYSSIPGFNLEAFLNWTIDPENTSEVFKIQQSLITAPRRAEMIQRVQRAVEASPTFMGLYAEKYFPRFPTMEELAQCPTGSLGEAIYKHLVLNNITLDFAGLDTSVFYQSEQTPLTYLAARGIRTHDIFHAVLGLGTSIIEEYSLLGFTLAQYGSPYHMVMMSSAYLHVAFHQPDKIEEFLNRINYYFQLGKTAEFFPGFPFESHLKTPLSEVQKMLKVPSTPWIPLQARISAEFN